MTTHQNYLFALGVLTLTSLMSVGLISYHIDPANIYHPNIEADTNGSPSTFAAQLLSSKNGLLWPNNSWNERDIKSSLAKSRVNIDCAIIGSSHAMQISSFRKNSSLTGFCRDILNLGVSGGTIEDYLAMSFILLNKKQKPNTIVFSVDPWSLDFRRDSRWERYKDSYLSMKRMLLLSSDADSSVKSESTGKLLLNLINPSYFVRSINQIGMPKHEIKQAPFFKLEDGINDPVFLPDGSLIYSNEYILNSATSKIPIGGGDYKIKPRSQISENAINIFEKLLKILNNEGISSIIVMTPYHHNVWVDNKSITVKALMEVEPRIRELGRKIGVKVLGSYNPNTIGCVPDEFYDYMHAKDSCLSKIDQ